ncbi:17732_t:CDS:2 [Funneliformis geosporum]|nr:17732_t:CDS:2 [Funneliformis geosporum]
MNHLTHDLGRCMSRIGRPFIVGHRGASAKYPENTMLSIEQAIADGAEAIEFDIRLTLDNEVVIMHDTLLDRTTTGHGLISGKNYFGDIEYLTTKKEPYCPISRFQDVLDLLSKEENSHIWAVIDVKIQNSPKILLALSEIFKSRNKDFTASSKQFSLGIWHPKFIPYAKTYLPGIPIVYIGISLDIAREFFSNVDGYNIKYIALFGDKEQKFIKEAHAKGKPVFAWTVNEESHARNCHNWGVDAIMTDRTKLYVDFFRNQRHEERSLSIERKKYLIIEQTYFYFRYFAQYKPLPGPFPLPFVGNRLQYKGNPATWASSLREKYGDFCEIYMGNERHLWLSRADLVEKIFSPSLNSNYLIKITPREGLDEIDVTTKGFTFNRNLKSWMFNRRFFNQAISSSKFMKQNVIITQNLFKEMDDYWRDLRIQTENTSGKEFTLNLSEWMTRFVMDVIFVITTNKRAYTFANYFNQLSGTRTSQHSEIDMTESENLVNNIHSWLCALQFYMDTPTLWRKFIPRFKERAESLKGEVDRLNHTFMELISQRRKEIEMTPNDDQLSPDMLTMLLTVNTPRDITVNLADDQHTRPLTDEEIRGNIMEAIVAGVDTTANTFCFIVYHLGRYPDVRELMLQEFNSVFGDDLDRSIEHEDLNKLVYCDAIIKEVSRMMSIVPVIFRMSIKDDMIQRHCFPAETQINVNVPAIHMNPAHWKNPEKFDPSRFLNQGVSGGNRIAKNSLLIFGGGPRMCPGKNLAMTELKTLMVLLYRKYDVELVDMDEPVKYHYSVIKHCDNLMIRIKEKILK